MNLRVHRGIVLAPPPIMTTVWPTSSGQRVRANEFEFVPAPNRITDAPSADPSAGPAAACRRPSPRRTTFIVTHVGSSTLAFVSLPALRTWSFVVLKAASQVVATLIVAPPFWGSRGKCSVRDARARAGGIPVFLRISFMEGREDAAGEHRWEAHVPAVTPGDLSKLPRIPTLDRTQSSERPVQSVTTAPSGFEGEGFPVRRAFAGLSLREPRSVRPHGPNG